MQISKYFGQLSLIVFYFEYFCNPIVYETQIRFALHLHHCFQIAYGPKRRKRKIRTIWENEKSQNFSSLPNLEQSIA
jgi:hypothetical protein